MRTLCDCAHTLELHRDYDRQMGYVTEYRTELERAEERIASLQGKLEAAKAESQKYQNEADDWEGRATNAEQQHKRDLEKQELQWHQAFEEEVKGLREQLEAAGQRIKWLDEQVVPVLTEKEARLGQQLEAAQRERQLMFLRGVTLWHDFEHDQTWWQQTAIGWHDLCQEAWKQRDWASSCAELRETELGAERTQREEAEERGAQAFRMGVWWVGLANIWGATADRHEAERDIAERRLSEVLMRVPEWCMEEDGTISCHICYRRQDQGHAADCARAVLAERTEIA